MKKYKSKAFNCFVGVVCMFSLCAVDSRSWWPAILFVASSSYLIFVAWHNAWGYEMETEDEE